MERESRYLRICVFIMPRQAGQEVDCEKDKNMRKIRKKIYTKSSILMI